MIKHVLITGDIHGRLGRLQQIDTTLYPPEETALIILGDAGFNYYLDSRDKRMQRQACQSGYTFYCVRGNHEARPADIDSITIIYDDFVRGEVEYDPNFPNIRYFLDGGSYVINDQRVLVIGGAYSVDKEYRLLQGWQWFENEQLSDLECENILNSICDRINYHFVLTHTCPYSWEPRELFLSMIDQSKVDDSTERWLEEVEKKVHYDFWLFGHFHGNKIVNSNAAMLYDKVLDLSMIKPIDKDTEIPEGFYIG